MDKVLITGATGQLGSDLVRVLSKDHRIVPTGRADFDITDFGSTRQFIRDHRPDVVIHAAAFTDVDECENQQNKAFLVNGLGTRNAVIAAREIDAELFYISTDYVFDGSKEDPYHELDQPNPINIYGRSKLLGEQFVKEQLNRFFIIRTAWAYGLNGRTFVKTMLKLGRENNELKVVNDQRGTPTCTMDITNQIKELLPTDLYGIYHCTSQGSCTWFEFAQAILSHTDLDIHLIPVTTEEFPRPAPRPRNSVLENYMLRLQGLDRMPPWEQSLEGFMETLAAEEGVLL